MRYWFVLLLVSCAAPPPAPAVGSNAAITMADLKFPADPYTSCAACHLADGKGVPGAFPPIRNRAASIAALGGGREYLILVASFGLMGPINADGAQYGGVMPGNMGFMSNGDIAGALNFLVFELAEARPRIPPFAADEVTAAQAETSGAGPAVAHKLRADLVVRHGERWPD